MTIVVVTHEPDVATHAGRILTFRDGRVTRDEKVAEPRDAAVTLAELPRDVEHEVEEAVA
jgi:putative ABC transport system ATP-binding protein